ncbi:MAG: molybdopterin-dependent oxidoreductase [Nodularia sp. CChRGM 3473]
MVKFRFVENLPLVILVTSIVYLGSCANQPTDQQLEVWRREAIARNAEIMANNATKMQQQWNLVIQGETATGQSVDLNWQQIQALATNHVRTPDPLYVLNPNEIFDFRGVLVSTLLKQFGAASGIKDITFVSLNSYFVTLSLQDLLAYPITLAIAKNGQPIPRDQGGPIYLVLPYTQYPQLKQKYNESTWAFYVSHMVVGTEPVQLSVGKRKFNLTDLDKLPQVTIDETVGYRIAWPSGKVKLHGVRVRDVLALSGEKLPEQGTIAVRAKPPIYRDVANQVRLPVSEVRDCDILLATRWGDERQLIPAKMGGPVTLALSSQCAATTSQSTWMTFVEELTIRP